MTDEDSDTDALSSWRYEEIREIRLSGGTHRIHQQKIHFIMEATLW